MSDEFARLDAVGQAERVRSGKVEPIELVDAAIARIERVDPKLNAVIHPLFEKARASARSESLPDGPLRGVPFLVKDAVCHTAGDPFHAGMRFLKERGFVARDDTELARRFRAAGLVFVGRTNTPELAMSTTTEPLAYGPTLNPWNLGHSTGGSSGGSAAAVAAGLVPAAHANDMGGSIRIPASFCGLVGLKPTRARGTLAPHLAEYWGPLTHEHVLTRSVRDSAVILDAIAGPACGDPYTAPAPLRPYAQEVGAEPGALRIGVLETPEGHTIHPDCADAVARAARDLEALGHRVEPIAIPTLAEVNAGPWIMAGIARDLDRWSARLGEPIREEDVEPLNWSMAEAGRAMNARQYLEGEESAYAWAREVCEPWREQIDLLLTPTAPLPPPEIGWAAPDVPLPELFGRLGSVTLFTLPST